MARKKTKNNAKRTHRNLAIEPSTESFFHAQIEPLYTAAQLSKESFRRTRVMWRLRSAMALLVWLFVPFLLSRFFSLDLPFNLESLNRYVTIIAWLLFFLTLGISLYGYSKVGQAKKELRLAILQAKANATPCLITHAYPTIRDVYWFENNRVSFEQFFALTRVEGSPPTTSPPSRDRDIVTFHSSDCVTFQMDDRVFEICDVNYSIERKSAENRRQAHQDYYVGPVLISSVKDSYTAKTDNTNKPFILVIKSKSDLEINHSHLRKFEPQNFELRKKCHVYVQNNQLRRVGNVSEGDADVLKALTYSLQDQLLKLFSKYDKDNLVVTLTPEDELSILNSNATFDCDFLGYEIPTAANVQNGLVKFRELVSYFELIDIHFGNSANEIGV
jgi:hypothetical protein